MNVHRPRHRRPRVAAALFASAAACAAAPLEQSGELRLRIDPRETNPAAAGQIAHEAAEALPAAQRSSVGAEALLRLRLDALTLDVQVQALSTHGEGAQATGRINELYVSAPLQGMRLTAGRRIVQWDVGSVFRPNDVIQQDQSRLLLATKPQGRTVLQAEVFEPDWSAMLVWVNPEHTVRPIDEQRGAQESAVAAMLYFREGATDVYGFGRVAHHTGLSIGAAATRVLSDSLSVYGSARALQRHDGWTFDGAAAAPLATTNPWRQATLGRGGQALVGFNWTGENRESVIAEWWYDATAPADATWDAWLARTDGLAAGLAAAQAGQTGGVPPLAFAANLAWQDSPLALANRRRQTVFVRLSWQPTPWLFALDTLYNPADSGHITTASLQWQGDRLRVNAALRWFGGPPGALTVRLPQRRTGLLAATWAF